eukprot:TRINITY_DN15028_c0_g1_i1.p1 TRINITY_DN15028_c0_g1~~TRINITY_DN15028_c0_g1_i1.p1  ORF type:complete len:1218 (-),score=158.09 TRINITY_DN15028_c0_g1_i1:25-3678(-)
MPLMCRYASHIRGWKEARQEERTSSTSLRKFPTAYHTRSPSMSLDPQKSVPSSTEDIHQRILFEIFELSTNKTELSLNRLASIIDAHLKDLVGAEQDTYPPQDPGSPLVSSGDVSGGNDVSSGRLGPPAPRMNRAGSQGIFQLRENDLEIESHSNFVSVRANVCVFRGRWMYEVTLATGGIQQLGWVPPNCPFTEEEGVGDSHDSYAYDGQRIKKWNQACGTYGEKWAPGDVIGCCLDADQGEISFYRNGRALGVAFKGIRTHTQGLAYFPGVSMSFAERSLVNLGARPLRYPLQGFLPLQAPAEGRTSCDYLVSSLERLATLLSSDAGPIDPADALIVAGHIVRPLAHMLFQPYHVENSLYPMLSRLYMQNERAFQKSLDVLSLLLEEHEHHAMLGLLMNTLSYMCRTASQVGEAPLHEGSSSTRDTTQSTSSLPLRMVVSMLRRASVLCDFVSRPSFDSMMEGFLTSKRPSDSDLPHLIPQVWWPWSGLSKTSLHGATSDSSGQGYADPAILGENYVSSGNERAHMKASAERLRGMVQAHEAILIELVDLFMSNATPIGLGGTPRDAFRRWLHSLLLKNKGYVRNITPAGLTDPSVLANLFFILQRYAQPYMARTSPPDFPFWIFFDSASPADYYDFTRIGGTLGHVQKQFPVLDEEVPRATQTIPTEPEMLDIAVFLFHIVMSQVWYKQAATNMQTLNQTIQRLQDARLHDPARASKSTQDLQSKIADLVRQYEWFGASLLGMEKETMMWNTTTFLFQLLSFLSLSSPNIFRYVPEFYIETATDAFHTLKRSTYISLTDPAHRAGLNVVVSFFILHFPDVRIANPDMRDVLLQSVSSLLQNNEYVRVFEENSTARQHLIPSLLSSFDNFSSNAKFWIPITMILLRFWRWTGFAQLSSWTAEGSSSVFREIFRETCSSVDGNHTDLLSPFLNRLFNNLNWAVSEFLSSIRDLGGALPQIRARIALNPEQIHAMRKVSIMFELSANLLRLVEIISREVPLCFLQNELNGTRLAELLVFVANRTAGGHDAQMFADVADALATTQPTLDRLNSSSLLAPIVGTLTNLYNAETSSPQSSTLVDVLVDTPGFSLQSFEMVLSFQWDKDVAAEATEQIETFQKLARALSLHAPSLQPQASSGAVDPPEEELCPICYTISIDTTFAPCGHQSCHRCIVRHMANSSKCFFCMAEISNVVRDDPSSAANIVAEPEPAPPFDFVD